jgi:hypothetical protein
MKCVNFWRNAQIFNRFFSFTANKMPLFWQHYLRKSTYEKRQNNYKQMKMRKKIVEKKI